MILLLKKQVCGSQLAAQPHQNQSQSHRGFWAQKGGGFIVYTGLRFMIYIHLAIPKRSVVVVVVSTDMQVTCY